MLSITPMVATAAIAPKFIVPGAPTAGCEGQSLPMIFIMAQPSPVLQAIVNPPMLWTLPLTQSSPGPMPIPAGGLKPIHTGLWPTSQERPWQENNLHTMPAEKCLPHIPQPPLASPAEPLPLLDPVKTCTYARPEWAQASSAQVTSEKPVHGAMLQPAQADTLICPPHLAPSNEELCPPIDLQQNKPSAFQGSSNLLEEIMAAAGILPEAGPLPDVEEQEELPLGDLEAPLSEEDFQALLDMLPSSPGPCP